MIVVTLSTGYDFPDTRSMYYIFGATQNDIQNPIYFFFQTCNYSKNP